jgi:hypothetical protein
MNDREHPGGLSESLETGAALGALLHSISHELNNHLTNLVLATESARHTSGTEDLDVVAKQLRSTAQFSEALRELGGAIRPQQGSRVALSSVVDRLVSSSDLGRPCGETIEAQVEDDLIVQADAAQLCLALALLLRSLPSQPGRQLVVEGHRDAVPRTRWSDETETVEMAHLVLKAQGSESTEWPPFAMRDLLADFYEGPKTAQRVSVMAAWEILRKVVGRPSARLVLGKTDGDKCPAVELWLPLAVDWNQ